MFVMFYDKKGNELGRKKIGNANQAQECAESNNVFYKKYGVML
jgi:hypothetical protein